MSDEKIIEAEFIEEKKTPAQLTETEQLAVEFVSFPQKLVGEVVGRLGRVFPPLKGPPLARGDESAEIVSRWSLPDRGAPLPRNPPPASTSSSSSSSSSREEKEEEQPRAREEKKPIFRDRGAPLSRNREEK